jgi:hypothetical protein
LWATGESVEERGGNIYLRDDKDQNPKRLTDSGKDHSPALSSDGSLIVFVRDLLGDRDYSDFSSDGPAKRVMQLWIAKAAGCESPKLVLDSPIQIMGRRFSGFYVPQFSTNTEYIYFLIQFAASSGAIVRLTRATGELVYLTDALDFSVIPAGKYKDDLVAKQHRSKLGLGYYDWFYLLKPNGEQAGVIGQDKDDVGRFVDTYVGSVGSCRNWNATTWMTCVNQIR